jgi:ferric-dicitrate binding protein FerR (iron transport regulator)
MNEEKKKEKVERLKKRLEHWVEHNEEHTESFRKAARDAEEIGLVDVSRRLKEAGKSMEEASALCWKRRGMRCLYSTYNLNSGISFN